MGKRFDVDNSGFITAANLKEVLGDQFNGASMEQLIKEADFEKDGRISYDEFIRYLQGPDVHSNKYGSDAAAATLKTIEREADARKKASLMTESTNSSYWAFRQWSPGVASDGVDDRRRESLNSRDSTGLRTFAKKLDKST